MFCVRLRRHSALSRAWTTAADFNYIGTKETIINVFTTQQIGWSQD